MLAATDVNKYFFLLMEFSVAMAESVLNALLSAMLILSDIILLRRYMRLVFMKIFNLYFIRPHWDTLKDFNHD